ncbi:DUF7344 domain-containing protein [Halomicrobium salinisoli]|uniref:DUF7344 domain-containing protein n=1 Tax=Halomicrobium salinisoli TaxID=2878391 RepID=UPI001CEFF8DD|nr:hypothetical protein [Halomicrobium salinisoli]
MGSRLPLRALRRSGRPQPRLWNRYDVCGPGGATPAAASRRRRAADRFPTARAASNDRRERNGSRSGAGLFASGSDLQSEPDPPSTGSTDLPLDEFCHNELFDLMGNKRRRYILCFLVSAGSPVAASRVAEQIAMWENDASHQQVTSNEYQSVYNSLYQSHFPRLERAGLIEYDRSENLVYPRERLQQIERLVDFVSRDGGPSITSVHVLGASLLFGSALTGSFVLLDDPVASLGLVLLAVGAGVVGWLL